MNPPPSRGRTQITCYEALAAVDASGTCFSPAWLLIESSEGASLPRVLAIGSPAEVRGHESFAASRLSSQAHSVLIPGLVNAHTHLDLTHLGPRPYDAAGGFTAWVDMIRRGRLTEDAGIADSVRRGIELTLAGGVVAVGDIAGAAAGRPCQTPLRVLQESPLLGVSFLEFFGIGTRMEAALSRLGSDVAQTGALGGGTGVQPGVQPHAPNTVDLRVYLAAAELARERGMRISTHLAETLEEREFVANGAGRQRAFLEELGLWNESVLERVGRGLHPVQHLAPALERAPFIVAHVNDCDDAAIETLARTRTSVAYCPRASAYFGAERTIGPHRYRDMLDAGINVCLGTDSIVNLPDSAADPACGGMSVLEEARFLYRRDGADAGRLLAMATVNGAAAMGLNPDLFRFTAGDEVAGVVAIEVDGGEGERDWIDAVLRSVTPPRLLERRGVGQAWPGRPVMGAT